MSAAGFVVPTADDAWAVSPLLALWSGDSIQVTPAFRVYADAAERTGLTLPFGKTAAATISTAFLYIGAARPQRFATATVASYYHNVIRLARLMLMEPDAATSRLVGSLVTKRIQRWGRPTIDKRGVFSRGDVVRAISLATVDPAVAAATAACWDAVSRAGSLLTRQSPGSRSDPTPRAQARVLKRRPFLVVELQVFEKMSKSWERLLFDTDPSSPQYNPTAVGAAAAIERLMAERRSPSEPLWRKRDGTHVVPSDLVAALQAANPHLRMCRITPHSFRISAASWLVNQAHVSRERRALTRQRVKSTESETRCRSWAFRLSLKRLRSLRARLNGLGHGCSLPARTARQGWP